MLTCLLLKHTEAAYQICIKFPRKVGLQCNAFGENREIFLFTKGNSQIWELKWSRHLELAGKRCKNVICVQCNRSEQCLLGRHYSSEPLIYFKNPKTLVFQPLYYGTTSLRKLMPDSFYHTDDLVSLKADLRCRP